METTSVSPPSFPSAEGMVDDAAEIGIEITKESAGRIIEFSRILLYRARTANLIGPGERQRLWSRHILESACYSLLLRRDQMVVDIGTGNGFPGMILAILGFRVSMVEPRRKRYLFLRHTAGELGLDNCTAVRSRIEDLELVSDVSFPKPAQFTVRSVAPPERLLDDVRRISGPGSTLVARKPGLSEQDDFAGIVELRCPPLDRSGFLVQYRV